MCVRRQVYTLESLHTTVGLVLTEIANACSAAHGS